MSQRKERFEEFSLFFNNSKEVFSKLAENEKSNKDLDCFYSFRITPGGWDGGHDKRRIEVW